jgi:hypothetical protein
VELKGGEEPQAAGLVRLAKYYENDGKSKSDGRGKYHAWEPGDMQSIFWKNKF